LYRDGNAAAECIAEARQLFPNGYALFSSIPENSRNIARCSDCTEPASLRRYLHGAAFVNLAK
jgi:hypothetical protein